MSSCRITTLSGLEDVLQREVRGVLKRSAPSIITQPGSVIVTSDMSGESLHTSPAEDIMSGIVLRSRFSKKLDLLVAPPFAAKWEKQAREGLEALPWNVVLRKNSPMPTISVRSSRSRMFRHSHVRSLVEEAISSYQGRSKDHQFESIPLHDDSSLSGTERDQLTVSIDKDVMAISIDAAGPSLNDSAFTPFVKNSRLSVCEVAANAAILKSFTATLDSISERTTLWDPFCGSGVIPFSLARVLSGIPSGSPLAPYPFRRFPHHDPSVFENVLGQLELRPHRYIRHMSVLGTDSSIEAVGVAKANLHIFKQSLPALEGGADVLRGLTVEFSRMPDAYTPPNDERKLGILTALPVMGDVEKKYKHFNSMVQQLLAEQRLVGCTVITSKPHLFKRCSTNRWLSDLRYFAGTREVECLRLVIS